MSILKIVSWAAGVAEGEHPRGFDGAHGTEERKSLPCHLPPPPGGARPLIQRGLLGEGGPVAVKDWLAGFQPDGGLGIPPPRGLALGLEKGPDWPKRCRDYRQRGPKSDSPNEETNGVYWGGPLVSADPRKTSGKHW